MIIQHFSLNENETISRVVKASLVAFPEMAQKYRKVKVIFGAKKSMSIRSAWDSGNRDWYALVDLATLKVSKIRDTNGFTGEALDVEIPDGSVMVNFYSYQSRSHGFTIYTPFDGFLEAPKEDVGLDEIDFYVLVATRSYKSSYGGVSDYRAIELKRQKGYSYAQINASRQKLISLGYLNKNNAINNKGKNLLALNPQYKLF